MPFGLKNALSVFQHFVNRVLADGNEWKADGLHGRHCDRDLRY